MQVEGQNGEGFTATTWAESYRLEGAQARYWYGSGPQAGQAAVTEHGRVTVIGAHSERLIQAVLAERLTAAGLPVGAPA